MKTYKIILILFLSIFIVNNANADASTWYNNKCNKWFLGKKHYNTKAKTTLLRLIPTCTQNGKSCYYSTKSECLSECASAVAEFGYTTSGGFVNYANFYSNCWGVRAGTFSQLSNKLNGLITIKEETKKIYSSGEIYNGSELDIDENRRIIKFKKLSGKLFISTNQDHESCLVLKGWVSNPKLADNEAYNEESNNKNTFWIKKIKLSDKGVENQLEKYGNFDIIETEDGHELHYSNLNVEALIPDDINIDEVNVEMSIDGGLEEEKLFKEAINNSNNYLDENKIDIKIYPNPIQNDINIELYSQSENNFVIEMFDMNGNLINSLESKVNIGVNNINIDASKLDKGNYYILINGLSENPIMKKLIKE